MQELRKPARWVPTSNWLFALCLQDSVRAVVLVYQTVLNRSIAAVFLLMAPRGELLSQSLLLYPQSFETQSLQPYMWVSTNTKLSLLSLPSLAHDEWWSWSRWWSWLQLILSNLQSIWSKQHHHHHSKEFLRPTSSVGSIHTIETPESWKKNARMPKSNQRLVCS